MKPDISSNFDPILAMLAVRNISLNINWQRLKSKPPESIVYEGFLDENRLSWKDNPELEFNWQT